MRIRRFVFFFFFSWWECLKRLIKRLMGLAPRRKQAHQEEQSVKIDVTQGGATEEGEEKGLVIEEIRRE